MANKTMPCPHCWGEQGFLFDNKGKKVMVGKGLQLTERLQRKVSLQVPENLNEKEKVK